MPNKSKTQNLYYSYDIKDTHYIAVNSEIPYQSQFTPEYIVTFTTWLENDLKTSTKKWKIIYLHRALYCSMNDDYHCISSSQLKRNLLEELILMYKVDLVIAGHVHAYERLYPIYHSKADMDSVKNDGSLYDNPKYPTHVVCGTGGNVEGFFKCNY